AAQDRLHRYLPGALARPAGADRRNRRSDADAVRPRENPGNRRQQFLDRPDRTVPPGGETARRAAALQSVRARDRGRTLALLPAIGSCDLDLRRAVPWP